MPADLGSKASRFLNAKSGGFALHLFLLSSFLLFSCASPAQADIPQTITAYSTSSAQLWMDDLFICADALSVTVRVTAESPDIFMRIGEPEDLLSPAYQIGEEELFIVAHFESPVGDLSLQEARALFSGSGAESLQAWVYPSELDLQGLFDQFVMQGRSVAPGARVAADPRAMSDAINADPSALGILPLPWVSGNIRPVFSIGVFPVLAVLKNEPAGAAASMLACLQGN